MKIYFQLQRAHGNGPEKLLAERLLSSARLYPATATALQEARTRAEIRHWLWVAACQEAENDPCFRDLPPQLRRILQDLESPVSLKKSVCQRLAASCYAKGHGPLPKDPGVTLFILDVPNIDVTWANLQGVVPTRSTRPRMDKLFEWLLQRAGANCLEADIFVNVPPGKRNLNIWATKMDHYGFNVFAKEKLDPCDDVDGDMLKRLKLRWRHGDLAEVIVASHDARCFLRPLEEIASWGIKVTAAVFLERAEAFVRSRSIGVIDLREIPGLFLNPYPRTVDISEPAGSDSTVEAAV